MDNINNIPPIKRIGEINKRLEELPKGTLIYKNIKGKKQPYLQRTVNGKSVSMYIKTDERADVLVQLEERKELQEELARLKIYYEKITDILADNPYLGNTPGIGYQRFDEMMSVNALYIDKTHFIKEWWESNSQFTLITRPRRFGKTLMLSTVNCFFSVEYKNRGELFDKLDIWKYQKYREIQGTYPVVFLSLAAVKANTIQGAISTICCYLSDIFDEHKYLLDGNRLSFEDKETFKKYLCELRKNNADYCKTSLMILCSLLYKYHNKKIIILLDEYDTPLQEAYFNGYWSEMLPFIRELFNMTFKGNKYIQRALLTGITRITKESLFSDINNIDVYTTTSDKYATYFGFTEKEVNNCLQCQNIDEMQRVKEWYDGYYFGNVKDIYNPWSIMCYVTHRQFRPYWANTGGYETISDIILQGKNDLKDDLNSLIKGEVIHKRINENIVFDDLMRDADAVWSLLLSTGYIKADNVTFEDDIECDLSITNRETAIIFRKMISSWFREVSTEYEGFCKALIDNDVELMNEYMNYVVLNMISFFDVGRRPSEKAPERFYHGLVLGLVVSMMDDYEISSNRESGLGRYDIVMIPKKDGLCGIIMEFKVRNEKKEASLKDTLNSALSQIEKKQYECELINRGLPKNMIRKYGFAFEGKEVLIG